jgi:nucleoside-diphosphate-sugar epimerase
MASGNVFAVTGATGFLGHATVDAVCEGLLAHHRPADDARA